MVGRKYWLFALQSRCHLQVSSRLYSGRWQSPRFHARLVTPCARLLPGRNDLASSVTSGARRAVGHGRLISGFAHVAGNGASVPRIHALECPRGHLCAGQPRLASLLHWLQALDVEDPALDARPALIPQAPRYQRSNEHRCGAGRGAGETEHLDGVAGQPHSWSRRCSAATERGSLFLNCGQIGRAGEELDLACASRPLPHPMHALGRTRQRAVPSPVQDVLCRAQPALRALSRAQSTHAQT